VRVTLPGSFDAMLQAIVLPSRVGHAGTSTQAIYLIFGLIEVLLVIRFVPQVLGANPEAGLHR